MSAGAPPTTRSEGPAFDPGLPYRCSPSVALRPEPFGALVYHFGTRRLSFLKTPQLVDRRVRAGEHPDVHSAIDGGGRRGGAAARLSARPGRPGRERNHRGAVRRERLVKLVDHFQYGLNSPICLTWELTYACNLACVHCLSSSGRRDPRELTTDECKAVVDELQRMQVFYVNIGGGEPTVRPDFWELLDYAIDHDVGVKFSTNGIKLDTQARRAAGGDRLRRRADLAGRRDRRRQRPRPRPRLLRHRDAGVGEPGRGRLRPAQDQRGDDPAERRPARRVQGHRRQVRRAAADHPAAAVGARRGRLGRAAPDCRAAAPALRLAGRARRGGADRRLVLPPLGLRARRCRG